MKHAARLLSEGVSFALGALVVNRLRTVLSLLGISIGIFAIISVFTMVDTMERSVKTGIQSLGDDVIFIEKMPWAPEKGDKEYAWWKYFQRPNPVLRETYELESRSNTTRAVAFKASLSRKVNHLNSSIESCNIWAVSEGYYPIMEPAIEEGRFFTDQEVMTGRGVCMVGPDVADVLFSDGKSLGKELKIQGRKAIVIGVFKRQGTSLLGNSTDEIIMVPVTFAAKLADLRELDTQMIVRSLPGVSTAEMKDEVTGHMRAIRQLRPGEPNNFAVNESSLLTSGLAQLFGVLNLAGLIIGGFSILVGGFSIANIMFVSVRERTHIIGIQKALGARRSFVLFQFLSEAVILSVIGGMAGLFLVFIGSLLATFLLDINAVLSLKNIGIGIAFSALIGLISGIIPAWIASRLVPVEAIRSNG